MAIVCNSEQLHWRRIGAHKIGNNIPNPTKPHHFTLNNEHNSPALNAQIISLGPMANEHRKSACLYHSHIQTPPPTTHQKQNTPVLAVKNFAAPLVFVFHALHSPVSKHSVQKHAGWLRQELLKKENIFETMRH